MKHIYLFVMLLFTGMLSVAQNSYVYIEGIKGIPFNVLSENKELVKLGKGYIVISYNDPGEKSIDITFLNSNFSKQRFVVDVQANSSYGFRLGKTEENRFYLIDIVNEGKIIETNSPVNLALSSSSNIINIWKPKPKEVEEQHTEELSQENTTVDISLKEKKRRKLSDVKDDEERDVLNEGPTEKDTVDSKVERRNERKKLAEKKRLSKVLKDANGDVSDMTSVSDSVSKLSKKEEGDLPSAIDSVTKSVPSKTVRVNNCAKIASDAEVKSIIDNIQTKGDDEDKLLFVKKKIVSGCFSSKHVFSMAEVFDTQYGRYSLAKFVVPLTSDVRNLLTLETLFKYESYKAKLRNLVE